MKVRIIRIVFAALMVGSLLSSGGPAKDAAAAAPLSSRPGRVALVTVTPGGSWFLGGELAEVAWLPSPGATAYLVSSRLMTDSGSPWKTVARVTQRSVTVNSLFVGRRYQFRVQPINGRQRGHATLSAVTRMNGVPAGRMYVALGDSYSSGLGAGGHESGGDCHRNSRAWAHQLEPGHQFQTTVLACAGATMIEAVDQLKPMDAFLARQPEAPQLITVTVGGNDAGFSDVLKTCVTSSCTKLENSSLDHITAIRGLLTAFYREIRSAHPYADIIAGGYPQVLEPSGLSQNLLCRRITYPERQMLSRLSNHLNMTIAEAADDAGIWTVGLMVRKAFLGHNACAEPDREWIHAGTLKIGGDVDHVLSAQTFHPRDRGQTAYADAFDMAIKVRAA